MVSIVGLNLLFYIKSIYFVKGKYVLSLSGLQVQNHSKHQNLPYVLNYRSGSLVQSPFYFFLLLFHGSTDEIYMLQCDR